MSPKQLKWKRQYFLNVSHFIINFYLKKKLDFLIPTFPKYPYTMHKEYKGVGNAPYFQIANAFKIGWWIYSNKLQEENEWTKRDVKTINNQNINLIWILIQTLRSLT